MASSSISKHPTAPAARPLASRSGEAGDILTTLKGEHVEIRTLLERLQAAEPAVERRFLVKQLKATLLPHSCAEEQVVYAALIALRDSRAREDGYEGGLEHEWASQTLRRLEKIRDPNSAAHRAAAKVLRELVAHHFRGEEHGVWNDIRRHFDPPARARLNREYLMARNRARGH